MAHHREELALGLAGLGGLGGQGPRVDGGTLQFLVGHDESGRHDLGQRLGLRTPIGHDQAEQSREQRGHQSGPEHEGRQDLGVEQVASLAGPELELPALPVDIQRRATREGAARVGDAAVEQRAGLSRLLRLADGERDVRSAGFDEPLRELVDANGGVDPARERRRPLLGRARRPSWPVDGQEQQEPGHIALAFDDLDAARQRGLIGDHGTFRGRSPRDARADVEAERAAIAGHRLDARDDVEEGIEAGAFDVERRRPLAANSSFERLDVGAGDPLDPTEADHPVVEEGRHGIDVPAPVGRRGIGLRVDQRPRAVHGLLGRRQPPPHRRQDTIAALLEHAALGAMDLPGHDLPGRHREEQARGEHQGGDAPPTYAPAGGVPMFPGTGRHCHVPTEGHGKTIGSDGRHRQHPAWPAGVPCRA